MTYPTIIGHQVVCSAFIEKDNKILIVMDPKFKVWRVPGGRAEHGETLEETLMREMKEETGISFEYPAFVGWGQDQQYHFGKEKNTSRLLMFFHIKADQEPTLDPTEAEDHKWVTLDELKQIENKEGGLSDFFERNPLFTLKKFVENQAVEAVLQSEQEIREGSILEGDLDELLEKIG